MHNNNQIKTMAFLDDIASTEEINKYYSTINQDNEIILSEKNNDFEEIDSDDSFQKYDDSDDNFDDEEDEQTGGGKESNFII